MKRQKLSPLPFHRALQLEAKQLDVAPVDPVSISKHAQNGQVEAEPEFLEIRSKVIDLKETTEPFGPPLCKAANLRCQRERPPLALRASKKAAITIESGGREQRV
jgi:hypothetical protein